MHMYYYYCISIACRSLVSVPLMASVVENSIIAFFKYRHMPMSETVQLPHSEDGYGWKDVQMSLAIPEAAYKEFTEHCITECACLSLNTQLMQMLPRCTSLDHEFTIACDIVQWCTKFKPKLVLK